MKKKRLPTYAIILASGTGTRFGGKTPKQYWKFDGKMVIEHTLAACDLEIFDKILLVVSAVYEKKMKQVVERNHYRTPVEVVVGGGTRNESCRLAVAALSEPEARVVIHNGIQPCVTRENIERCLAGLEVQPAVTSAVPCIYTVLRADRDHTVVEMPNRAELMNDMGVECFRLSLLRKVFSGMEDTISTDIIGMVFRSGLSKVLIVEGDPKNIKITHREDLAFARKITRERSHG